MLDKPKPVTGALIKKAIEGRDGRLLASFYADDAVLHVIDRNNPPSRPRVIRGRAAIAGFWDDICSRTMTHHVDADLKEGPKLAFSQECAYPDGTRVYCIHMLDVKDDRIVRQVAVQAWDE
jgi:ketosteroid isomerase-like protein